MTFKKYNHSNNAHATLRTALSDTDTTMILDGTWSRFPTSNFIVRLEKRDTEGKVTARENIHVATRSGATCIDLQRAYEAVPIDDDAGRCIQQALNFDAGDSVDVVISSEIIQDIQDNLFWKLDKNSGLRTGFGANKTVVVDANWNEIIKNRITTAIEDTDSVVLRTNNMDERVVRIGEFKQSMTGWTKKYTAWENITGVAPIPVMIAENVQAEIDVMFPPKYNPSRPQERAPYDTRATMYGGVTGGVTGGYIDYWKFKIRQSSPLIIDLGKIRKLSRLIIKFSGSSSSWRYRIYKSNNNSDFVEMFNWNCSSDIWVKELAINNNLRYIKISLDSGYATLEDLKIFEEITLNGVYTSNSNIPVFNRVDGFIFKNNVNTWEEVDVSLVNSYDSLGWFDRLNNKEIYLEGKGTFTINKTPFYVWIIKNNKLFFDTKNKNKIEKTITNYEYLGKEEKKNSTIYSNVVSINSWSYKVSVNGRVSAYTSNGNIFWYVFAEYSIDWINFIEFYRKNFSYERDRPDVDESLYFDLNSWYVRLGIRIENNVNSNNYFNVNNLNFSYIW